MQLVHSCLRAKLGIVPFFSTFSPVPKRYPKRYLSDTLLVHKSSQIHPVPSNQKERKSRPKRRQKTGIESPNGHEHRQLQFNLIYISDLFITISYVHAPNTVKRYSELRKTIPMSHRAPQLYWVLPAAHIVYPAILDGWSVPQTLSVSLSTQKKHKHHGIRSGLQTWP